MLFNTPGESFYNEKSTLDILDLVNWKKQNNSYNFKSLPKIAMLVAHTNVLSKKTKLFLKRIKGITGKNYILSNAILICTGFGNGAPSIVSLMEELRGLGVKKFLFVGYAGRLDNKIAEGEICVVEKTYSTSGCTMFYGSENNFYPKKNEWFLEISHKLKSRYVTCWSTDAPFRETPSLINKYRESGAKLVDMECAAIYAFAQFYGMDAFCVLLASDSLYNLRWQPPSDTKSINLAIQALVKNLVKHFSNG